MTRIVNRAPVDPNDRFAQQIKAVQEQVAELQRGIGLAAWTTLTLSGTWVEYSAGRGPQIRKISDRVSMRGVVKTGATSTIATLPVGYRPPTGDRYAFACVGVGASGGEVAYGVTVQATGVIQCTSIALPVTYLYLVGEWSTT